MPRYTVVVDDEFDRMLNNVVGGGSKADAIRKAVSTYAYLKSQVSGDGTETHLSITDQDGHILKNVVLP